MVPSLRAAGRAFGRGAQRRLAFGSGGFALRRLLRAVFGELRWEPPRWLRALARWRREAPRSFFGALALLVVLASAGYAGWRWWESRPRPTTLEVSVAAPRPTPLPTPELPEPRPFPLVLRFSGAAAPLEDVGREVTEGLVVTPPVDGTWRWVQDRELVFEPAQDWPVGESYELRFEKAFFAPQALLERYELEFSAPRFSGRVEERGFYEDPTDPKNKRATATLSFTHPVDRASLEKRLALRLRVEPAKDFDDRSVLPFEFRVSYDEIGAKAFVQSAAIALPEQPGEMQIALDAGVVSARGGPGTAEALVARVPVPSVDDYFRVEGLAASVVTNDAHEMERVVTLQLTAAVQTAELASKVTVYELPKDRPALGDLAEDVDHRWKDPREVVPEVLAKARELEVTWLPTEREFEKLQAFRFTATPGRWLYVRVEPGVRSFGDFALARPHPALLFVDELPRSIEILHEGSLLSLSGERKLSVLVRNLADVEIELSRLKPDTIALLVSQSRGSFQEPSFSGRLDADDLAEVFREVRALPATGPGEPHYAVVDFSSFVRQGAPPRGLFQLRVRGYDRAKKRAIASPSDTRIVLLTDLGLLVKRAQDGSHELFVLSLRSGEPVDGAEVAILGRNGLPAFSARTDSEGRASLPSLGDLEREKAPTVFIVEKGGDLAFLPYQRHDRRVNLSRFDVGGVRDEAGGEALQAFLFSDRGIYRPGEDVRLGLVVKPLDWSALPEGLPLELVVTDPRGVEVRKEPLAFPREGFRDFTLQTLERSPTGVWNAALWIVRDDERRALLGATRVRVEEFQPDRLALDVQLSAPASPGWVAPAGLSARVGLRNLFGTPAAGNLVKASLELSPSYPAFAGWSDWRFFDPLGAKQSYDETLAELRTNEQGEAVLALGLERFTRATYRLRLLVEAFEADGGRRVAMDAGAVVSPLPWLLAWKPDGDLAFIRRGNLRTVELRAVGPDLVALDGGEVTAELFEKKSVSVLQRQPNGLLSYQSVAKEEPRGAQKLVVPAAGASLALPTDSAGSFVFVLRDTSGTEINRVPFEVVGEGNLAARIDRNAELSVKLAKSEYAPGEEIELEVRAPYAGAGLVTIERERVHAAKWFRTDTTASVQRIRLPASLDGNGYVVVSFVRSLDSPEIFLAPLSSGAAAFALSREPHAQKVRLEVPDRIEPGARLRIGYEVAEPTRLAILAVDEGVLQVARWRTPDPLGHFFRKRALEVETSQILDLLLPEFELLRRSSAPGGGEDALLAGNLNPFKRKGLPPVAYWSGVFEAPAGPGAVEFEPPDHFQGSLRVVAVAVDERAIGVAEARALVRGAFVLQPTVPTFAAPGDEFEASTLVANALEGSGRGARITVSLTTSEGLEVVDGANRTLEIDEGRDANASFRVKVIGEPSTAQLAFEVSSAGRRVRSSVEMSVRPASPYRATLATREAANGGELELPVARELYPQLREVETSAATSPFGLVFGLAEWLAEYPYGCTEQIVSAALPQVVLGAQPDLEAERERAGRLFGRALATLQGRQDADGAFGLWAAGGPANAFVNAYATHFLVESGARGQVVPQAMLARALGSLDAALGERARTLAEARAQAYALYLVTRKGEVRTKEARALAGELLRIDATRAKRDVAALLLASVFRILRLEREAGEWSQRFSLEDEVTPDYASYYDALVHRSLGLYLLAKHFPERAKRLGPRELEPLLGEVLAGRNQTLSSALAVLALDAHAALFTPAAASGVALEAVGADGVAQALPAHGTLLVRAQVPPDAETVRARGPRGTPLYAQLVEAGFDRTPPADALANGVEIRRELRNAKGEVVDTVALGEKLDVVVRVRATDGGAHEVALVDLLPGGFEVELGAQGLVERASLGGDVDAWRPTYVDVREDRVVFYGWIDGSARAFVYRISPTNRGSYAVPPLQAEGLYERGVEARATGGRIEVRQ